MPTECPDGVLCSSTIPSHYKKYSHFLLAHSRSVSDDSEFVLSQETYADHTTTSSLCVNNLNKNIHSVTSGSFGDSKVNPSSFSNRSASSSPSLAGPDQPTSQLQSNALLLLRSPALEDIKKKKGWSPSGKKVFPYARQDPVYDKPVNMDLKPDAVHSTSPLELECLDQTAQPDAVKDEASSDFINDDDYISFSPLSEMPNKSEEHNQLRRELFPNEEHNNSMDLSGSEAALSDGDSLFSQFMDQCDVEQVEDEAFVKDFSDTPYLELTSSSLVQGQVRTPGSTGVMELPHQYNVPVPNSETNDTTFLQSPQSLVLERLRECVSAQVFHTGAEENLCSQLNQGVSQNPVFQTSSQLHSTTMAPRKTQSKAGAMASGLKQTDIGVFFGAKPLKDSEKKTEGIGERNNAPPVQNSQQRSGTPARNAGRSQWRRRKDPEVSSEATEDGEAKPREVEGGRRQGGWRRWNRRAENGQELVRPCPFYKKIPGECAVQHRIVNLCVDRFCYMSL